MEANRQHLTKILNGISDAAIATDHKGFLTFMNPVAETLTGWEMKEVSGKHVTDILDIYVGNAGNLGEGTFLIEALQRGSVTTGELSSDSEVDYNTYLIAKSGREIPIDYNITPVKDQKENFSGIVITFHNISKYKRMEEQLHQTISKLRHRTQLMKTVFNSMNEGIVVVDLRGRVLFVNPSIQQMLGTEPPGPFASRWAKQYGVFYPDKETRIPFDQILTRISRGEEIRDEEFFVCNEEQPEGIHVRASAVPLFGKNQEVVAYVCILRNLLTAELEKPHSFDDIVGKSQNMQQMFALMQRAAESDISVLISGESGTGKELVARAIHANSPRKGGPFITVNCAAIPETLIESELFGHE